MDSNIFMTATGHALVGVLIATKFQNPTIAIPLALASHIVCDFLPHWDAGTHYKTKTTKRLFFESAIDVGLSIMVVLGYSFVVTPTIPLEYMFLIVFCAQWLDWIAVPLYLFYNKPPFSKIVQFSEETNTPLDKPWGVITQIAFIVLTCYMCLPINF